jgi:ATP:corrinoid adenosyltransferase
VEYGILTVEEILELLAGKNDQMALILTGRTLPEGIEDLADDIYRIEIEKES